MIGERIGFISKKRINQLFLGSFAAIVLLFLLLGYVAYDPNSVVDKQIQALGTIGGLLLSLLLLVVYIDMSQAQDEQHEFLQDLNSPDVYLKELRYTGTDTPRRPKFTVSLSNLGSDAATDLELATRSKLLTGFEKEGTEENPQIVEKESQEWKIESRPTSLSRRESLDDDSTLISQGRYLEEGETNQDFDFVVEFEPAKNSNFKQDHPIGRYPASDIIEAAVYDKRVGEDEKHYSEFSKYRSYGEIFRERSLGEDSSIGYTEDELRELASTLPFQYLVTEFELTYGKQNRESISLGTLIIRLDPGLSEDELWGDALEYEEFLEEHHPGTPDPIYTRRSMREEFED
ncbi:hypothetical protein [Halosimplex halophilum]|uniref:hypothetical protein n=1 Tax=Halosimplex halophilum TaxID=2559572 RepID=UPI00107F6DFC|nr:hypothetical protein [Halosimplex halophilum]